MRYLAATLLSISTALGAGPVRDGAFVGELVAARDSIRPGETIDLALRIEHDEGFHTYWKAPGIVGVPTAIDWIATGGLRPAEIGWPQPQRVKMGPYWSYGYEQETFLVVPLAAPADAKVGRVAKLKARVSFMVCPAVLTETESCYPGFVDLELEVPISEDAGKPTRWAKPVAAARATFARTSGRWEATARAAGEKITLTIRPRPGATADTLPKSLYFYSSDGTVHSDREQAITRREGGEISIGLVRSEFAPEDKAALEGILYTPSGLPDGSGAVPIAISAPYLND